ncbi:hypothetical protein C463_10205 [Halorubrum californiense DSM 19288]|uniref:DUF7260 domain-containing protein n=1 Tax=Halorubrum californiense DSM 19288 TaxID=1227465 RepID=M0E993_9EURY|nr:MULTISPECIES: hypothetical protein [Halorubrum]ELZ42969.1 hypothetical protein C463_10205 [Halorubrum californiense DSM 19288]TKX68801.1 hypothetical protein EXE40_11845 [Halorubrum sp. GN11GM_10-3_MGM]
MAATHADDGSDPIRAARSALRVERRRVVDEREALSAFRSRVSSIPDENAAETGGGGFEGTAGVGGAVGGAVRDAVGNAPRPGSRLVAVREAYRDTVMSVPHYAEEYDDTYERSVSEEFGPEMAYALTRTQSFRAEYKRSLLGAVETAVQEREAFLDALESEIESVERAGSRLDPIRSEIEAIADELGGDEADAADAGFGALDACRTRTVALREDCDRIAARRQRVLADHERRLALGDDLDLPEYCYQRLDVSYPALAAVGTVGDRLEALRSRIERAMACGD